jgi:hypothetical protein
LYNSTNIISLRNAYKILVGNHERNRPLRRPRRRWDDKKNSSGEIWWVVVDWKHLVQDSDLWWALVNTVMNLRFP